MDNQTKHTLQDEEGMRECSNLNKVAPLELSTQVSQMEPLEVEDVPKVKPSLGLFHVYAFSLGMGLIQLGWCIGGNSQTGPVFIKKYGWDPSVAKGYNTIIGSSAVLGLAIGSLLAGKVMG